MACQNAAEARRSRRVKLFWTRRAQRNRQSIREYIARENPAAALDLDDRLAKKARQLVDHPELGRLGRVVGTRELIAHRNYILVYDVVGSKVRVVRVLHAARRWPPMQG